MLHKGQSVGSTPHLPGRSAKKLVMDGRTTVKDIQPCRHPDIFASPASVLPFPFPLSFCLLLRKEGLAMTCAGDGAEPLQ